MGNCDGPGHCHICDDIDPNKVFHICSKCGAEVKYYSFFHRINDPDYCGGED